MRKAKAASVDMVAYAATVDVGWRLSRRYAPEAAAKAIHSVSGEYDVGVRASGGYSLEDVTFVDLLRLIVGDKDAL